MENAVTYDTYLDILLMVSQNQAPGTWYQPQLAGPRCPVPATSAWQQLAGPWYQACGARCLVAGTRYLAPSAWYLVPGARHLAPQATYMVPGT